MRIVLSIISILLVIQNLSGQVAIIQDPDGWTNVRKSPNQESEVVHKIYENQVFWFSSELEDQEEEWVSVHIPSNRYSLGGCDDDYNMIDGYIHRSRLMPLEEMKEYKGEDILFAYKLVKCDLSQRNVNRIDGKWITKIDGRRFFGTDGPMPKIEVAEVKVNVFGKDIEIHEVFYSDIFECTNAFNIYKKGDTFFIYQFNSDGAGAYEIVWVLNREGLLQRLVGTIF